jgi:hypothetical protein
MTKSNRRNPSPQDPLAFVGTTHRLRAERQNAITCLQHATRRCLKHFGAACGPGLLAVVARELGAVDNGEDEP